MKFGTDGLRGNASSELTASVAFALGRAAARTLGQHQYLIAVDGRESGPVLAAALEAGLRDGGATTSFVGMLPTPGIATLAARRSVAAAMISASHNPFYDNGIKLFAPGGRKLSDDVQAHVQEALDAELASLVAPATAAPDLAAEPAFDPVDHVTALAEYEATLLASVSSDALSGMRVVLDCANGAASELAPAVFGAAGAEVVEVLHDTPDGRNINEQCGSTHPADLQAAVVKHRADVGIAFDGDADRVQAIDADGRLIDGDHLIALMALERHRRRELRGDSVVVTVMSNLGFHLAMRAAGIGVVEAPVGDRYVLDALEQHDLALGGEQSGHLIFRDLSPTGDGMLAGLQVLSEVVRRGEPLGILADHAMTRLPQVLVNVRVSNTSGLANAREVWDAAGDVERQLGGQGRVLLRASGTEPLVRVMVEAPSALDAQRHADHLADVVRTALA